MVFISEESCFRGYYISWEVADIHWCVQIREIGMLECKAPDFNAAVIFQILQHPYVFESTVALHYSTSVWKGQQHNTVRKTISEKVVLLCCK